MPCRARSTRSMPYFSSAWNLSFGVLIGHARAAADGLQGLEHFFFGDGVELAGRSWPSSRPSPAPAANARSRRTRPSSPSASAWAASSTLRQLPARAAAATPPLDFGQMLQLGLDDLLELRRRLTPIFSSTGRTMPSSSSNSAASRCSGSICGLPALGGQLLRALHGFLGFDRQFVESKCHDSVDSANPAANCRRISRRRSNVAMAMTTTPGVFAEADVVCGR